MSANPTVYRELTIELTEAEVAIRASELAAHIATLAQLEEEKKKATAEWKEKIQTCSDEVEKLAEAVRSKKEQQQVACTEQRDWKRGRIAFVREDTHDVIGYRDMTEEEKQGHLDEVNAKASRGRKDDAAS